MYIVYTVIKGRKHLHRFSKVWVIGMHQVLEKLIL